MPARGQALAVELAAAAPAEDGVRKDVVEDLVPTVAALVDPAKDPLVFECR